MKLNLMNSDIILQRLRLFLLLVAASIFVATPIELWLAEHYGSAPQFIPFVLCGLGLIAILLLLVRPRRSSIITLRVFMAIILLGTLFGVFEHIEHNLEFALEIRPNAAPSDVFLDTLRGANPLLAPGILALGAILALAATYWYSVPDASQDAGENTSPNLAVE